MVTGSQAYQTMLDHHELLERELALRLGEIERRIAGGQGGSEIAKTAFLAYLESEIFPHAIAEEYTIYEAARAASGFSATVDELLQEHRALEEAAIQLLQAEEAREIAEIAGETVADFSSHVAKENNLLHLLLERDGAGLPRLLAAMEQLYVAAKVPSPPGKRDLEADLARLLLDYATATANAGLREEAAKTVASAWALLQHDRPDLAAEAARRLHRIAGGGSQSVASRRSLDPEEALT